MLQPVLYSLAVEQALGTKVASGRLFYATTAGGFAEHEIPINDYTRGQALEVLEIVDRAVEIGFLPAAPSPRRVHAGATSGRSADRAKKSGSPARRRTSSPICPRLRSMR